MMCSVNNPPEPWTFSNNYTIMTTDKIIEHLIVYLYL